MTKTRSLSSISLALIFAFAGIAHATVIEFTPSSASPNTTGTANAGAYGSDSHVSVGYSPYVYSYPSGYATLDGGTGAAIYSDSYNSADGTYDLTMTFTAAAGYTVTLNSFELATFDGLSEADNISVTGGTSAYSVTGVTPSTSTFTTYSPGVTGTSLVLTITNLYDVGLNTISYSETAVATAPEPSAFYLALLGPVVAVGSRKTYKRYQVKSKVR